MSRQIPYAIARTFRTSRLALILPLALLGAAEVHAGRADTAYTDCKTQLQTRYGEDTRVKLKRTRERRGATEVQVRVHTEDGSFTSTCRVTREGELSYTDRDGEAVAAQS